MVKGQGHTVTKTVTVAPLLVTCAAVAGVGLHVDTTAYVFEFCLFFDFERVISSSPDILRESARIQSQRSHCLRASDIKSYYMRKGK